MVSCELGYPGAAFIERCMQIMAGMGYGCKSLFKSARLLVNEPEKRNQWESSEIAIDKGG